MGKRPRGLFFGHLLELLSLHSSKVGLPTASISGSELPSVFRLSGRSIAFSSYTFIAAETIPSNFERCDLHHRFLFFIKPRPFATNPTTIRSSTEKPTLIPALETERRETHVNSVPIACLGVGKSVILRCSHILSKKAESFEKNSCLQDLLKLYGDLSPETTRPLWRVPALKPEDFLELLLGFKKELNLRKVEFLWNLFRWAVKQSRDFRHLARSYEIMISMLIRAQKLVDAESLLLSVEASGVLSDANVMFSEIIQGYVEACELERSVALYKQSRDRGLVLSASCYRSLLDLLIRMQKAESSLHVYMDMVDVGFGSSSEDCFLDFIVRSLSKAGKILEAVKILQKVQNSGVGVSPVALTEIVSGYCRKKDFEDMLKFMEERKHIPEACVCNKIVSSLCRYSGGEEAWLLVRRMEVLGFESDAITFGILIGQSCRERNLRNAFIYLSESFSRSIKLKVDTYNALISGIFKEGMHWCAKDIFEDMVEKGLMLDPSTFRVLLAGYSKYRKFDEVKQVLSDMIDHGLISLAPAEDPLSKVFTILGLDRLGVKVKRDNGVGIPRAEFFDSLGNGLYLDTDLEEYDMALAAILESAMVLDFDYVLLKECREGDVGTALGVRDEGVQWGHNFSLLAHAELLKTLCASTSHIKKAINLLEEMPELSDQLDHEVLNLLIRTLSKNGMTVDARLIFDRLSLGLVLDHTSYMMLVEGFVKEQRFAEALGVIDELLEKKITPCADLRKIKEAAYELQEMLVNNVGKGLFLNRMEGKDLILDNNNNDLLIKKLCLHGSVSKAIDLLNIMLKKGNLPSETSYSSVICRLCGCKAYDQALDFLAEMQHKNLKPSVDSCDALVCGLSVDGRTDDARSVLRSMVQFGLVPTHRMYNYVIDRYSSENNLGKASELMQEMQLAGHSPDFETHWSLISYLSRGDRKDGGDDDEGKGFLSRLLSVS